MILIVHRKNFNYINIKHSTIQYIKIKLLTTSHGQNETFETFFNKNKNWRNKKKNSQRNFNDGFPLGPRLFQIACEGTYVQNLFIPSETKEIKEGEKVQRKPMEGIEEDIRWSGGNKRKMKLLQRRKMTFPMVREGKAPKN